MKKVEKNLVGLIVTLICTFILTSNLEAATLTVGSNAGVPGDKDIPIPIYLSSKPGENTCSFNLDLNFDTSRLSFKEVSLGTQAKEAGKSLLYSRPSADVVRVIVVGFNQNIIGDGTVLNFTFDILSNAPMGKAELNITKPSISDPSAHLLPVNTENGEIIVEGEPTNSTTTTSTITPTTVITTTSTTTIPQPPPDSTTTTSASDMSTSSTTTSISQIWPLLYDVMWGNKKERNLFFLRAFRDEVLVNTDVGREYIFMLYKNSLEIAILLLQEPSWTTQTGEVINELLISIDSLLYNDKMAISQDTIDNFESLLDQFESKASPGLKTVIKRLRKDIREEKIFKQLRINITKSKGGNYHDIQSKNSSKTK